MLPKFAIHNRTFIGVCVFLVVCGGIWSYLTMGRLEDPEFSIKTAVVVTVYPGATTEEVEQRVTNVVERAAQQVKGVETIRSFSKPGVSFVMVDLFDTVAADDMPTVWQELRNKVSDTKLELPIEAFPPIVKDDFGDVYGIVIALSADGFSDAELRDMARSLQKELLLIDQVRRVELWGLPEERIEIEISRAKMTELNVHPLSVVLALQSQNLTSESGEMTIGNEKIRVTPNGSFQSIEEIENLILPDGTVAQLAELSRQAARGTPIAGLLGKQSQNKGEGSRLLRLRDIAQVHRVAKEEPSKIMRSNGKRAVAIALSPIPNGNVIRMGRLVQERLNQIKSQWPLGVDYEIVSYQPQNVEVSIHAFTKNLREAIIIVTLVVMIAMGWRSGLLITSSLLVVILGTLCVLKPLGMDLHRSSLGALIIALGILVDDAVVVGDLILVRMQRGMDREKACIEGARRASNQLLGATIVGALAFWPIYLSPGKTGQYAGALFIVLAISLMISWFVAMLQTPVVYYMFVHPSKVDDRKDPHGGPVYRAYRYMLETVLHHKTLALLALVVLLVLSAQGFKYVPKIFFPRAQRTQFMIDYWLPEGSSITAVSEDAAKIEDYLKGLEGVKNVGTFLGSGPPRFYLPYEPEFPNSSYGQLVVNVNSLNDIDRLIPQVDQWIKDHFPQAQTRVQRFALGPTTKTEVEVRVSGPEIETLRMLAGKVRDVLDQEPTATFVRDNWREMIPTWSPEYSQSKGTRALVSRGEMIFSLRWATKGLPIATYADGETLLPIVVRSAKRDRDNTEVLETTPVWGHSLDSVPLSQVTEGNRLLWEPGQIHRRNRVRTITVGADAIAESDWSSLMKKIKPEIEAIKVPEGYKIEWGGQYSESAKATGALMGKLPVAMIFMMLIVVALFNHIRQPMIIVLTFPLAAIGITCGMLLLRMPFGFMALIGAMSLLGMMVRNGVVLMDQIDEELAKGEDPYHAIVDASVERMRPVTVAAMTVIVGMIPLLSDPLFDSMATAIMFGLIFATFLTLFMVPVFYMILFGVKLPPCSKIESR